MLILWQTSAEGQAIIRDNRTQIKAERNAKKRKSEGGGGNSNKSGGGGGDDIKGKSKADKAEKALQKKYQAAVAKATKKLVASSIEAKKAKCAAIDLSLESAIKRQGGNFAKISATSVIQDDDAVAEKKFTQNQTKLKLSAVKSRINKLKKDVSFKG